MWLACVERVDGSFLALRCGGAYLFDDMLHRGVDAVFFELAFPDGYGCPAHLSECCHGSTVALDVATELCLPKLNIALGPAGIALGAAMPKATVDKDGDLAAGEGDVGLAGNLPFQAITRKARGAQALSYEQLGLGVGALVALHGLFDGGSTADQFALVSGEVRGIDAVEQTGLGTLLAAALRCALGLGGGLVGRGGLGVVGSAVGLEPPPI